MKTMIYMIMTLLLIGVVYAAPWQVTSCGELLNDSGEYVLAFDIDINSGTCLEILGPNINFSCAGYTIDGNTVADYGIHANSSNVRISDCTVRRFNIAGIMFDRSTQNGFINNNLIELNNYGIDSFANGTDIYNNNFSQNAYGLYTEDVVGMLVYNNRFLTSSTQHYWADLDGAIGFNSFNTTIGNYWDTYSAACTDADFNDVCDIPYNAYNDTRFEGTANANYVDRHPQTTVSIFNTTVLENTKNVLINMVVTLLIIGIIAYIALRFIGQDDTMLKVGIAIALIVIGVAYMIYVLGII